MSTATIKKKIIDKLNKTNDEHLLSTIYDVLKDESKKEPLILSGAQIKAIKIAEGEIKEGISFRYRSQKGLKHGSENNLD